MPRRDVYKRTGRRQAQKLYNLEYRNRLEEVKRPRKSHVEQVALDYLLASMEAFMARENAKNADAIVESLEARLQEKGYDAQESRAVIYGLLERSVYAAGNGK